MINKYKNKCKKFILNKLIVKRISSVMVMALVKKKKTINYFMNANAFMIMEGITVGYLIEIFKY